ncbi:ammonium transporter [Marinomonas sp. 2405UD68-3]|uniref:ammonium transporter n=1 Tax=Marinomonas sp. 2405UD68-3 TaxID=3391835 RepID=UPI0039C920D5
MEINVIEAMQRNLDLIWIIVAAALVLLMQAGFTALESGVTRSKNSINVAMKNLVDLIFSVLVFWLIGYGLMFGSSEGGFLGSSMFMLDGIDDPLDMAIFVFQITFAGTAVTIISGAVAERMRFAAYAIIAIITIGFIYPVSGHWIWNADGWLAQKSFVDFAGSTVVHSLGGWVGLAGALMLGARTGRFDENGNPRKIHGQNLVMAVIGVMILWFGWIGFNGGSTLSVTGGIAKIVANTLLAAAAGGLSCFIVSLFFHKGSVSIEKMLNGIVGGLVSITAGCAVVEPLGALLIGLLGGVIVFFSEEIVLYIFKIDDPVNVISAHGVAGAWGTLSLAMFAPVMNLPLDNRWDQFIVQLQGVLAVFVWGFVLGVILFGLMRMFSFLRVSQEAEKVGLNVHEHDASSGLLDTMQAMDRVINAYGSTSNDPDSGNLTQRIDADFGSEGYEISVLFNRLMDYFHDIVFDLKKGVRDVIQASELLQKSSQEMQRDAESQYAYTENFVNAIQNISNSSDDVCKSTEDVAQRVLKANERTKTGQTNLQKAIDSIQTLTVNVESSFVEMTSLQVRMKNIEDIVETIRSISDKTNLLALNAAIESARAGESGRGFAVVADEVRNLSKNTFAATETINELITDFQRSTDHSKNMIEKSNDEANNTVKMAQETYQSLENIAQSVEHLLSRSQLILDATSQQNSEVGDINKSIDGFINSTDRSKTRADQVSETSKNLQELATDLEALVQGLQVDVRKQTRVH